MLTWKQNLDWKERICRELPILMKSNYRNISFLEDWKVLFQQGPSSFFWHLTIALFSTFQF